jgi:hypothetical protein
MKFVKQRHERDCLVAFAAMLADLSYEKVWRDQRSGFSEEKIFHFRAMHRLFYFSYLGFEVGRLYLEDSSQPIGHRRSRPEYGISAASV